MPAQQDLQVFVGQLWQYQTQGVQSVVAVRKDQQVFGLIVVPPHSELFQLEVRSQKWLKLHIIGTERLQVWQALQRSSQQSSLIVDLAKAYSCIVLNYRSPNA